MEVLRRVDSTMIARLGSLGAHHHEDGRRGAQQTAADPVDMARTAHNPGRDRHLVGAQDSVPTLRALTLVPSQGEETLGEARGIADAGVRATAATVREMAVFLERVVAQAGAEAIDHRAGEGDFLSHSVCDDAGRCSYSFFSKTLLT